MGSLNTIVSIIAIVVSLVGCGQLLPSADKQTIQPPTTPQTVELRITVDGTGKINVGGAGSIDVKGSSVAADQRCECGCDNRGCECISGPGSQAGSTKPQNGSTIGEQRATKPTRPIVVMLSDYAPGQCGACDAAWRDWLRDGASWPFELRKESPNRLGDTSPTFEWSDRNGQRRPWRPPNWSDASELIRIFTASQK